MSTVSYYYATWQHVAALYAIRCDPDVVRWSFRADAPTWMEHCNWLNREMTVFPVRTFVAVGPGEQVFGCVSVVDGEVNVMVNPLYRREGFGRRMIEWAQKRFGGPLRARVKFGNTAALKLFAKCGFNIVDAGSEPTEHVLLVWEGLT